MATDMWERALPPLLYKMGLELKKGVAREFIKAQLQNPNSPFTMQVKGGKPPLHDSGRLERAMKAVATGIQPINTPQLKGVKVTWQIPESRGTGEYPQFRGNNEFEYMWVHEFGSNRMSKKLIFASGMRGNFEGAGYSGYIVVDREWKLQKRPFFFKGMETGRKKALVILRQGIIEYFVTHMQSPRYKPRWLQTALVPQLAPTGMIGFGMYFAPPSSLYKYPGMFGDFMGVASGALFTERAIAGYIRQYAWGQIGMTRKSMRRKFRRKLYSNR